MTKMGKKREILLNYVIFSYLSLPVFIFFIGWLRPLIGLPFVLLLGVGIVSYLRNCTGESVAWNNMSRWQLLICVVIAFVWTYLSGVGGYSNQDWDHHYRNAVFSDLIRFEWPVYFQFAPNFHVDFLAGHRASLNYYFTFWLPAALVGKILGQSVANACLLAWTFFGIVLVFLQLFRLVQFKRVVLTTLIFILWSGLDIVGKLIIGGYLPHFGESIEIYYYFSYTSFTTDLFNAFNQAIPAWLITLWVLTYRQKIPILPIALLFPYAPFPFISLTLFYVLYFFFDFYQTQPKINGWVLIQTARQRVDPLSALAAGLAIGFPFVAFYKAHMPVQLSQFFGVRFLGQPLLTGLYISGAYLLTFILEAGIFFFLIWRIAPSVYQRNKLLFWLSFWMLLLIPLWEAGIWRDFASRGSIPVLTVLALLTILAINQSVDEKRYKPAFFQLLLVLLLSWVTPFWQFRKAPAFGVPPLLRDDLVSLGDPQVRQENDKEGILSSLPNFYSMEPQHKFFYRLLAKRPAQDPDIKPESEQGAFLHRTD